MCSSTYDWKIPIFMNNKFLQFFLYVLFLFVIFYKRYLYKGVRKKQLLFIILPFRFF